MSFINRLSTEVAYDVNWSLILPRILNAGFLDVMNPALLGMFYRIGSKWNMAFHLSEKEINKKFIDRLKKDMINKLIEEEFVTESNNFIKFTKKGYALCDEIVAKLI